MEKKVGIIGAMDVEVKLLKSLLKPFDTANGNTAVKETVAGGLSFVEGTLDGCPVVIVKSGIGKVNSALCAQRLAIQFGVTHIINTGIAGAMAHGLGVLDFVVSTDAMYHDFDVTGFGYKKCVIPQMDVSIFKADDKMIEAAKTAFAELEHEEGIKIVAGRIASGDQFISSKAQKDVIKADCDPACVEMEGTSIAHACHLNKVPFVIIRCMSDMADDTYEKTYDFNEEKAANMSAALVRAMLKHF